LSACGIDSQWYGSAVMLTVILTEKLTANARAGSHTRSWSWSGLPSYPPPRGESRGQSHSPALGGSHVASQVGVTERKN
jgi:hypothetical protein